MGISRIATQVVLTAVSSVIVTGAWAQEVSPQTPPKAQPGARQPLLEEPQKMKVELGVGLGWHICDERSGSKPPPLQEAFLCEGLVATPQGVEVELTQQPARNPNWKFFEGSYKETTGFKDISTTLELNVAWANVDGQEYAYVDGRLTSVRAGKKTEPVYFRFSAEGGFDKLGYSSAYGNRVLLTLAGIKSEYAPYVAVQKRP